MGFDKVFESGDPSVEFPHFCGVVGFSLFDCLEQCLGDALQGVRVEVRATIQDIGC